MEQQHHGHNYNSRRMQSKTNSLPTGDHEVADAEDVKKLTTSHVQSPDSWIWTGSHLSSCAVDQEKLVNCLQNSSRHFLSCNVTSSRSHVSLIRTPLSSVMSLFSNLLLLLSLWPSLSASSVLL